MNMFDISFDCDFVQARYVSNQQGQENSSKLTAGEATFYVCKTGNRKPETGNAKKKSGPKGRVL
jgi:hypothetical protein